MRCRNNTITQRLNVEPPHFYRSLSVTIERYWNLSHYALEPRPNMTSSLLVLTASYPRTSLQTISALLIQSPGKLRNFSSTVSTGSKKELPPAFAVPKKIDPSTLFSASSSSGEDASHFKSSETPPPPISHKQKFVKTRLLAGEWDPQHRDPLFRPPWKAKAKIISAEDFAARPTVSFEEEFSTLAEGMIVLSWLTEDQRQAIYQMYLDTMIQMAADTEANHITSHEYVVRVIGQKFNISYDRVAAIVQLAHNEEQIKKEGKQELHVKAQEYVDAKVREHIQNVYQVYGEVDPKEFVEDPLGSTPAYLGRGRNSVQINPKDTIAVDDLYDVDALTQQTILREKDEAQSVLDSKVYLEDVDNDTVSIRVNHECRNLLKVRTQSSQSVLNEYQNTLEALPTAMKSTLSINKSDEVEKNPRPRWKYIAYVMNEYEEKKKLTTTSTTSKKKKLRGRKDNTLVEHDGILRAATLKELSSTSWAPSKNYTEKIYQNVKAAWLERQMNGTVGVWGRTKQ